MIAQCPVSVSFLWHFELSIEYANFFPLLIISWLLTLSFYRKALIFYGTWRKNAFNMRAVSITLYFFRRIKSINKMTQLKEQKTLSKKNPYRIRSHTIILFDLHSSPKPLLTYFFFLLLSIEQYFYLQTSHRRSNDNPDRRIII